MCFFLFFVYRYIDVSVLLFSFLQVGSRMVIVSSGVLMVVMGVFGKVGAVFTTIPSPVIGGMFMVMFGVISAAGVSNLQVHVLAELFTLTLMLHENISNISPVFRPLTSSVCRYEFISKHLRFWLLHVLRSGHS